MASVYSLEANDVTKELAYSKSSLLNRPKNQLESSESNALSSMDMPHSRKYLFSRDDRNEDDKRHWVLAPKSTISCEQAIKNLVIMKASNGDQAQEDENANSSS